jgi:hypothetical protein
MWAVYLIDMNGVPIPVEYPNCVVFSHTVCILAHPLVALPWLTVRYLEAILVAV